MIRLLYVISGPQRFLSHSCTLAEVLGKGIHDGSLFSRADLDLVFGQVKKPNVPRGNNIPEASLCRGGKENSSDRCFGLHPVSDGITGLLGDTQRLGPGERKLHGQLTLRALRCFYRATAWNFVPFTPLVPGGT